MSDPVLKRNAVNVRGTGRRPLMFAHGFGCDQEMWRSVAPAFEKDHKVVLFDLTGAGQSDLSAYDFDRYATLDAHAEDFVAIARALELEDVILVGHSVSATIAVLAAIRAPEIFSRLILIAPSPCFRNDGAYRGGFELSELEGLIAFMEENYLGWSEQLAPTIAGQDPQQAGAQALTQSFCRTDPAIARHFGRVTFLSDRREDMKMVPCPALVLQVETDAIAPVHVSEWLKSNMPGATLSLLPVTGHCPHLTAPDETIAAMRAYLRDA